MEYLIKNLLPQNTAFFNPEASITPTLIGAIIFSLTILYVLAPKIERMDIDRNFYISTLPWLISAGGLSALFATGKTDIILNGAIFASLTALMLTAIHIGELIEKRKSIDKSYTVLVPGLITSLTVISALQIQNTEIFLETFTHIFYWLVPISTAYYLLRDKIKIELLAPIIAHLMDASSTVTSIRYGASEQQFVARLFIESLGPYGIFLLKAISIIPIVYIIDRETDGTKRIFYLYVITALGLVITFRNVLLTATGL